PPRTVARDSPILGVVRGAVRRDHQHNLRRRRTCVRDLSLAARAEQGAVPRHDGFRDHDEHLGARHRFLYHRLAAEQRSVAHRANRGAGGIAWYVGSAARLSAYLARGADARRGTDPARLRRLAYGP